MLRKLQFIKKRRKILALMSSILFTQIMYAFPGGTYTINPSASASATNYLSFTAFANDLRNIARGDGGPAQYSVGGAGLQGHVVCNVTPGTYNERINLTAIVGASSSRTVTINGNGAVVAFTPTSTTDAGVISLNGTDFFTFNNLEVQMNQTTYGYCFRLYNAADNNIIKNCKLRCNNITGIPNVGSAYVWINNGTTGSSSGNSGNNNLIDSCDMRSGAGTNHGPYYGINMYGITTPAASNAGNNNSFTNNLIRDFYLYGINHPYSYNTTIINNTITNQGRTSVFTTKYGTYTITGTFSMENNRIYNLNGNSPQGSTIYPIYISMSSTAVPVMNSTIRNNWIYDFGTTTLQCYLYWFSGNPTANPNISLDVDYNTIAFDYPTTISNTSTIVRNVQGMGFRSFRNNILYNNIGGTGSKWLIYDQAGTANTFRWTNYQNNCLFFGPNAAGNLRYGYGVLNSTGSAVGNLTTIQDMYNASFPTSNISTNPNFISINPASVDLTPTSITMANKGTVISGLTIDNGRNTRNTTTPDIGAIEYFADVELTNFTLSFPSPTCAGFTTPISGTLKNNSAFTVRNPIVAYRWNNDPKVEYTVPSTIAPGASVNFTFPTPYLFSQPGINNMRLFISSPDDVPSNDSIERNTNITPAPGGSIISHNTSLSSSATIFEFSSKPDLAFRGEPIVYDVTPPRTGGTYGTNWRGFVTARTVNGTNASAIASHNGAAPFRVTVNPTAAWEDSIILVSIRILNLQTFCDTTYTRRVLVAPKANPDFILPQTLCEKSEIYFENTSTVKSGSMEYEWDFGDGSPTSDEASPIHEYSQYGPYQVKLKTTTLPYRFTTEKIITVNITEIPQAIIIADNKCQGQNIVLSNNTFYGGSGATSYEWTFDDGSPKITQSTRSSVTKTYTNPGAYKVTLKALADGCADQVTKNVYVFAKPTANFTKVSGTCLNHTYEFENNTTIAEGQFGNKWDFNDNGNFGSDHNTQYKFSTAGTKNVKLIVYSEFGCKDSITKPVTVLQTATTDFSYPFACDRTPTTFQNLSNLNGENLQSYNWNYTEGTTSVTNPTVAWQTLGPKNVTLTTTLQNGCVTSVTKQLNVGVQPNVNFDFESKCANQEIGFTNLTTYSAGTIEYKWIFDASNSSTETSPKHTFTTGQSYNVKLIAQVVGGCADSTTKVVNVAAAPSTCNFDITRNYQTNVRNFVFTPTGGSANGISYAWIFGDGARAFTTGTGSNHTYTGNLNYCITMVATTPDGCECSATKCIDVNVSNQEINKFNVNVYPNPSTGLFNIEMGGNETLTVKVVNILGETIAEINATSENNILDLNHLNSGVYILNISNGNENTNIKINIIK